MISEEQEEIAALYALGALDADEVDSFERALAADPALRELTRGFRDAAATVVLEEPIIAPPARLRGRIIESVATLAANKVVPMTPTWVPWAAAAALAICCGLLVAREGQLRSDAAARQSLASFNPTPDALAQISFCSLEPQAAEKAQPQASVAWDRARRLGMVRLNHLEPPAAGKDYQLWVVEEGVPKPVSAGVVHVKPDGAGEAVFKPMNGERKAAQAFAISVEDAGGVPEGKGPIVLLGKL